MNDKASFAESKPTGFDGGGTMKSRVFPMRVSLYENPDKLKTVAERVATEGEFLVAYRHEGHGAEGSIRLLVRALKNVFGVDVQGELVSQAYDGNASELLKIKLTLVGVDGSQFIENEDIVCFTDEPWDFNNLPGGKNAPRFIDMLKRGKPFTASYRFPRNAGGDEFWQWRPGEGGVLQDAWREMGGIRFVALVTLMTAHKDRDYQMDFRIVPQRV